MKRLWAALLAMLVFWAAAIAALPKGAPSENLLSAPCSRCIEVVARV